MNTAVVAPAIVIGEWTLKRKKMPAAVDGLKECSGCAETKPVSEYHKNKSASDGLQYACRSCQKKHYENNKEKIALSRAKYYQANKEAFAKRARKAHYANREKILERQRKYHQENKEHILKRKKKYYEVNKEKISEYHKEYLQKLPAAVYKIENKITGKIYIGQSKSYRVRWDCHRSNMRLGQHPCIQHDYDKYGLDSFDFSVIQEYPCDTDSDILFEHEQRLIDKYLAEGKELYNISRYS